MCTWILTCWTLQISVDWDYWNVLKLWQTLQWFSFWFIDMIQWWSDARLGPETVFLWWGRYPWTWSWLWWTTIIIIIIWVIYCHYTRWRFFQVFVHNENIIHQVWHRDVWLQYPDQNFTKEAIILQFKHRIILTNKVWNCLVWYKLHYLKTNHAQMRVTIGNSVSISPVRGRGCS